MALAGAAILAVVVVAVTSARERLWHATHVLMALGMIVMFAPMRRLMVVAGIGKLVFAVAAYMFVAMAVGTPATGGMGGMRGM